MTSALDTQIGGSHYKTLAIQPIEFSMANRFDACAHTVLKYLIRQKGETRIEDWKKASHTLDLRRDLLRPRPTPIPMAQMLDANGIEGEVADILMNLETLAKSEDPTVRHYVTELMKSQIQNLVDKADRAIVVS